MTRLVLVLTLALLAGCSDQTQIQRTVKAIGAAKLREQSIMSCSNVFPREGHVTIAESAWPPTVRAFRPMSVWTEPDGVYLLLDTDAAGERGVFVPRLVTEKDPICGPKLTHVKLDTGVYWYERKR